MLPERFDLRFAETFGGLRRAAWQAAAEVFRTDLDRPEFAHLEVEGTDLEPSAFSRLTEKLARELGEYYRLEHGRALVIFSQGTFDQQVTTAAHRDGGPDESVLVLGSEPTTVASRLLILDFSRAARDRGLDPTDFLARFNPIFPQGRKALEDCFTEVVPFDSTRPHIVIINNSNRPWAERKSGMLGVLHQAIIPQPDPSARRMVLSLLLAPLAPDAAGRGPLPA